MPRSLTDCIKSAKFTASEEKYLTDKFAALKQSGLDDVAAGQRAIREFQDENLSTLNNLYAEVGVEDFTPMEVVRPRTEAAPLTQPANLENVVGGMMGNQGLSIMEADIRTNNRSVIPNITQATEAQKEKIESDFGRLKELFPEKNLQLREENNSWIIESATQQQTSTPIPKNVERTIKALEEAAKNNPDAIDKILEDFENDYSIASLAKSVVDASKEPFVRATDDEISNVRNAKSIPALLDLIISTTNDPNLKVLAQVIKQNLHKAPFLEFRIGMPVDRDGYPAPLEVNASYGGGKITVAERVFKRRTNNYFSSGLDSGYKTILHELTHAFTLDAYRKPKTNAEREFKQYVDKVYKELKSNSAFADSYGFKSPEEFIAEIMTNPEFRLSAPIYESGILDKIIEYIAKVFGYTKDKDRVSDERYKQIKDAYNFILTKIPEIRAGKGRKIFYDRSDNLKRLAEAYHKAKADGSNPDLVKAVEKVLSTSTPIQQEAETPEVIERPRVRSTGKVVTVAEMRASQPPPTKNEGAPFQVSGEDMTGITHAQTEVTRTRYQLPLYERNPESIAQWDEEALVMIQNGYNVLDLLSRMESGNYFPSAVEQRIMIKYIASLEAKIDKDPSNANLRELKRAVELSDRVGGSDIAKSLVARKGSIYRDDSLSSYLLREMEENDVDELTEPQKAQVKKEYEEIKAANEAYRKKIEELQEQLNAALAAKNIARERKSSEGKQRRTTEQFKDERDKIFESIREKLKKSRGEMKSSLVPYASELIDISPDVFKLLRSYAIQGFTVLADIVDEIHAGLQPDIPDITKTDVINILAGDYREPKKTKNELAELLHDLKTEASLISQYIKLEEGQIPVTEKRVRKRNKELADLRKKIRTHDLTRLTDAKKRMQNQIDKIEQQLKTGDFTPTAPKEKIKLDQEGLELQEKLINLKQEREARVLKDRYEARTKFKKGLDKVLEVINVPRTVMASLDYSAPLRQAIIATISHPPTAWMAAKEMFKSSFSQKNFDRWFFELRDDPNFEIMRESGLQVTDPFSPFLTVKEEQFMNNLAEKIPIAGQLIKGSERAYVQYLNKLRVDLFNRYADRFAERGKTFQNSLELYKKMAGYVNNVTGRGNIGKLEEFAPVLNTVFFSPRLIASRLNLLNPVYFYNLPKEVKAMYAEDMLKFLAFGLSVVTALAFLGRGGDDEDEIDVELDPRSSDFMKIRQGRTRWDIWGGFQPYIRIISQLISGSTKSATTGKVYEIDPDKPFNRSRGEMVLNFFRNKLAPIPSSAMDLIGGENSIGEKVTVGTEVKELLLPLNYQGIKEAYEEKGVQALFTAGIPSTFGIGVQTYEAKQKSKNK